MYLLIINEAKSTKSCSVVAKHSNMKNLIFLLLCFAIHLASTSSLLSLKLEKSFTEDRRIDLKTDDDEALFLPEEEFTLCLHFKINSAFERGSILKDDNVNHEIHLYPRAFYGICNWMNHSYIFNIPENAVSLFTWIHFCISFNESQYWVVANGKLWGIEPRLSTQSESNLGSSKISTLTFGPSMPQNFEVSNLNIWPISITKEQLNCENDQSQIPVLNWSTLTNGKFSNSIGNVEIQTISIESLCKGNNIPRTIVQFIDPLPFDQAIWTCSVLDGQMYLAQNTSDLSKVLDENQPNQCLQKEYWIPLVKNDELQFVNHYSGSIVSFTPWERLEPNGRRLQKCAYMTSQDGLYGDAQCKAKKKCYFCQFSHLVQFKLRGLNIESKIDKHYVLIADKTFNHLPIFQGVSQGLILFDASSKSWIFYDADDLPSSSALEPGKILGSHKIIPGSVNLPVGLREWMLIQPDRTIQQALKLTKCNDNEYTCSNGQCIDIIKMCDEYFDCVDSSDEGSILCHTVNVDQDTYRKRVPPTPSKRGLKTRVNVGMEILSVEDIDIVQMQFKSKFILSLKWQDQRIEYRNMFKPEMRLTETKDRMWIPPLHFSNSISNAELTNEQVEIMVLKNGQQHKASTESLHESVYSFENNLLLIGKFEFEFKCKYYLQYYPLDTHNCYIELDIGYAKIEFLELIPGSISYQNLDNFVQLQAFDFDLLPSHNGTMIRCSFLLKRKPFYYLFTTFFPTLCIVIMSLLTLCIHEQHFESNIMVSLTSMLVLYTLHQSIITQMPATAYLKFMDCWLIFCLTIPFVTFITLVSWKLMSDFDDNRIQPYPSLNKKKYICKKTMQIGLPLISVVTVVFFISFAFSI